MPRDEMTAKDPKETAKGARPVRRPSRPRRTPSAAALAALAPASDTHDMVALDRMHASLGGAPAPRAWAPEGSRAQRKAELDVPVVERPTVQPISAAEAVRRRREFAEAYAARYGSVMAPPSRRPIVTRDEILRGMTAQPPSGNSGALHYHPDVVLDRWEAARYAGHTIRTFRRYVQEGRIPTVEMAKNGPGFLVSDLDDYRAGRPVRRPKPTPTASRASNVEDAMARARGTAAQLKRKQALERIDRFAALLQGGADPEEAAHEAGYSSLEMVRQTCRRVGRGDVLQLVPDRRRRGEGRAA